MVKRIVAGLVGVGLIGGVGSVAYNPDGSATVTIDDHGKKTTVNLPMEADGKSYTCPDDIDAKLSPYDVRAGRITLTLRQVRKQEKAIEKAHPGGVASKPVTQKYNRLTRKDDRLVDLFNKTVDERNAILERDCD
jgi:hypothetical protein